MPSQSDRHIIILTNDDGIDAPGIAALREASSWLGDRRVIAPSGPRSGCGHVVTTHGPLGVHRLADGTTSVDGSPADCVRVALHEFGSEVAWVLSGINAGGNLGADLHHSGTVAAVREAAIFGVPGIALSHYIARGRAVDWDQAARWASRVLRELLQLPHEPGSFWNVNLPHPEPGLEDPEIVMCPVDPSPLPLAYRPHESGLIYCGDYQSRPRRASSDVDVCFGGRIAVSRVHVISSVDPRG
jgi:5'-nucleotidase